MPDATSRSPALHSPVRPAAAPPHLGARLRPPAAHAPTSPPAATCLRKARSSLLAGVCCWRDRLKRGPTRNVSPLAPAGPPDFGALRARGKLLLPVDLCVTSGTNLQGAERKAEEAEVTRRSSCSSGEPIAAQGRGSRAWVLKSRVKRSVHLCPSRVS